MDRWVGSHPLGWGLKGDGFKKIARAGEPAHDATVTISAFWSCPTHWHHDFGACKSDRCDYCTLPHTRLLRTLSVHGSRKPTVGAE